MGEFFTVFRALIPIFSITLAGLFIRKLNWLTEEADQSLLRVNVNLLMPCLILDTALGNPALTQIGNVLVAPVLGYASVALGFAVALACRRLHGIQERKARRAFVVGVGLYNYSYLAIPLAILLFDKATTGVLFVFNAGVEMSMWTLGVLLLAGGHTGRSWRKIVNGPLIGIFTALVINALNWESRIPGTVRTILHWLGQCSVPMALILIGAIIGDHLGEFHPKSGWRVIGSAALLRLGILPCLFLLLAKFLPISLELKRVMVLQAAMPSAVMPIILSRLYGGDPPTAVRVAISTCALALLTIPLWLRFGIKACL